jgi:hypothetical protein
VGQRCGLVVLVDTHHASVESTEDDGDGDDGQGEVDEGVDDGMTRVVPPKELAKV